MALDPSKLNERVEFDSAFEVTADGEVIDRPDVWTPTYLDDDLDSGKWETWSQGYTGQYGYDGPVMHNSEYLGGRMAADLLADPGVYAITAAEWTPDDDESDDPDELITEGWVIAKLKEA